MKTLRFFALAAALLLAWGCRETPNDGTGRLMILRWENLPAQFDLSDVCRIEVTTANGTQQRNIGMGGLFYLDEADTPVESVTVHFSGVQDGIRVDGSWVTVSGNTLSIVLTLVYDRATLDAVRENLSGNYLQIADIDLAGGNWTPIGGYPDSFTGTYDGGGLAIRNMTVNITNADEQVHAGLFGVNRGTLRNIQIEGGSVSGESPSSMTHCGGVCGYNYGMITACSNSGTVSSESESGYVFSGGVCGRNGGTITACSNTGEVSAKSGSGNAYCGGVCGWNNGMINACSNIGEVNANNGNGNALCGGVCGVNDDTVTACYNTGIVSGTSTSRYLSCGGVCGVNYNTVTACYNTGNVTGSSSNSVYCGGVCGENYSTITYCYWGGASASLDNAVGLDQGTTTTETHDFSANTWPSSDLPGWGQNAPVGWDATTLGAWSNPWESLGGWNGSGSDTVYPTLKSPN